MNALRGVLATLLGMAAAHFVAALTNPSASPVYAVGSTVIDLTPTPVKEWAISQFGTNDKPILIGSVLIVTLIAAGLAGFLARRRFAVGAGILVALVVIAGILAMIRDSASWYDFVPAVVAGIVGVGSLRFLLTGNVKLATPAAESSQPSRRGFLIASGAIAVTAALAGAGEWITRVRTKIVDVAFPKPADPAPPLPNDLQTRFSGLSKLRTPNEDFYRVDINLSVPNVDINGWTLKIDGDVENELEFSFDDLLNMPLIERDITMTCVSNDVGGKFVGAARWIGVPLVDLLDKAGVGSKADQILSTADDGFTISTPLEVATDGRDAMIVLGMNGEALPREHGYPVRMITPGIYGYVGATKWLTKLTLTTYEEQMAYWTERDWAIDAPIKISSRIDTPKPLTNISGDKTAIAGVAWAQRRGISKVEVKIDDGEWQEAKLGPEVNVDYWRQFYLPWTPDKKGLHDLAVRATDGDGTLQTDKRAKPFPNGSSGVQSISVVVE